MFGRQLLNITLLLLLIASSGCAPAVSSSPANLSAGAAPSPETQIEKPAVEIIGKKSPAQASPQKAGSRPTQTPKTGETETKAATAQPSATAGAKITTTIKKQEKINRLPVDQWKKWPVIPTGVSEELHQIYQQGLKRGNNPRAFSILGDCQSQPEVFLGIFDQDPAQVHTLPELLQETVTQFAGSFDRYSPTVKDGTTEGALLWIQWNDNKEKKCNYGETPIDCELRVHRPSIVFVHIGTHYEARNRKYLEIIIEKILEKGAVPVLVTKADNRELDERVNHNLADLAAEYNLPFWNFWASVQHLPENGMEKGSDTYLSDDGLEIHRMGALEVLDFVWRAVR